MTAPTLADIVAHGAPVGVAQPPALHDFYNFVNGGNGGPLPGGLQAAGDNAPGLSGAWLTGGTGSAYDTPEARADLLARIQKFDPNASITQAQTQFGGDDAKNSMQYMLQFDQSKLPAPGNASGQGSTGDYAAHKNSVGGTPFSARWNSQAAVDTASNGMYRPGAQWSDPNYGQLTDTRNVKPQGFDWLSLAPMLIAAIPSMGASLGIAGMTALSSAQSLGMAAFNAAGGMIQGADPLQSLLSLTGPVGSALGVPSYATTLLRLATQPKPPSGG